jgi:hypothetical protein
MAWVCCYKTVNTRTINGGAEKSASASVAGDTSPAAAISRIESDIKGTLGDMGGRQNRQSPRLLATPSRTLLSLDGLKLTTVTVCTQFSTDNSCLHLVGKRHRKYIRHFRQAIWDRQFLFTLFGWCLR